MSKIHFTLRGESEGRPVNLATHKFTVEVDDEHRPSIIPRLLSKAEGGIKKAAKEANLKLRREAADD